MDQNNIQRNNILSIYSKGRLMNLMSQINKSSININNDQIINNFKILDDTYVSGFQNILEKFKLQYDFYHITSIDSSIPIQLKIINYKKLIKIDNKMNVFINEMNQYWKTNESNFQKIQDLNMKQKIIQNKLDQFKEKQLKRIANQIMPQNVFQEKEINKYQLLFRKILIDYLLKIQEQQNRNQLLPNNGFFNYLIKILNKCNTSNPGQLNTLTKPNQKDQFKTIQLFEDHYFNQNGNNNSMKSFRKIRGLSVAIEFEFKSIQFDLNQNIIYYKKERLATLDEALTYYDKVIQLNPNDDNHYNKKGFLLKQFGRLDEAIDCYDKAIQLNSNNETTYNYKGAILRKQGLLKEALKLFDRAFQINPNNDTTYIQKGLVFKQLDRPSEALQLFDIAISLNSENFNAYIHKSSILQDLGKYDEALNLYDYAIQLNPQNHCSYRHKALLLSLLDRFDESIKYYDKAIKLNQFDYKSYKEKAIILHKMGDNKGQEEHLQLYEKHIPAHKSTKNKSVQSKENDDQYIKSSDEQVLIHLHEGAFLQQEGKLEEAILKFKQQLLIDPQHRISLACILQCLQDLGRRDEAMEFYKKVIAQKS